MVAYLLAVDREQRAFVPAEEQASAAASYRVAIKRRQTLRWQKEGVVTRRPAQQFSASAKRQRAALFTRASSHAEYERVLCVWLRASLGLSCQQLATVLGWHPGSGRNLQVRVLREGVAVLEQPGRGGRQRAHLTTAEEEALLADFCFVAGPGGMVEAGPLRVA